MKQKILSRLMGMAALMVMAAGVSAANPFLPLWEYIPDGEPYVFEDPDKPGAYRVYVYGSHDMLLSEYCGRDQVVWSAPVDDLKSWRFDGVIFESKLDRDGNPLHADGRGDVLYAPDVALRVMPDGSKRYYLYPNNQEGGRKTVYGYWGFERSYAAEFDPETMASVKPGCEIVEDLVPGYKQDETFRFFEASSMRKIQGKYVFVYSRWTREGEFGLGSTNYTLAYAWSDNPLGPFTYGGTIIDGRGRETAPDGTVRLTAHPGGNPPAAERQSLPGICLPQRRRKSLPCGPEDPTEGV